MHALPPTQPSLIGTFCQGVFDQIVNFYTNRPITAVITTVALTALGTGALATLPVLFPVLIGSTVLELGSACYFVASLIVLFGISDLVSNPGLGLITLVAFSALGIGICIALESVLVGPIAAAFLAGALLGIVLFGSFEATYFIIDFGMRNCNDLCSLILILGFCLLLIAACLADDA